MSPTQLSSTTHDVRDRYINLLMGCLTRELFLDEEVHDVDLTTIPADAGHDLSHVDTLAVSADTVRAAFERYGLLDDRVRFLEGWFSDTLPSAQIEQLAVLRLDGDLYESTIDALHALYPKLSVGGFVIVDDYGAWEPCRRAVDDFRSAHGISEEITKVDWTGVHWRRSA